MKQKNVQLEALMDSKKEYMEHLFDLITEPMIVTFQELYQECLTAPETRKKGILNAFQDALSNIASWNHHLIKEHYDKIVAHSGCKYIPDLIRALISVQVKINLLANSKSATADNIKLKIPSPENFVHRFYIDVARGIWKRPYLLYHNIRSVEKQQNLLDLEKLIQQTIRITLRGYVPMEQLIAKMHLHDVPSESSESDTDTDESESESENESEEDESDSETDQESDVESIVEVVELPEDNTPYEELQNEAVDITVLHEESDASETQHEHVLDGEPESETDVLDVATNYDKIENDFNLQNVATNDDKIENDFNLQNVATNDDMKDIEYNEIVEPDSPDLHVNKVPESEPATPVLLQDELTPIVEDRTTPFNMMIMNRKIITHRPPTTMVIKKKKKDAFF